MKSRGYRYAVSWIARNDDLSAAVSRDEDALGHMESTTGVPTVALMADLFDVPALRVAHDVLREYRDVNPEGMVAPWAEYARAYKAARE